MECDERIVKKDVVAINVVHNSLAALPLFLIYLHSVYHLSKASFYSLNILLILFCEDFIVAIFIHLSIYPFNNSVDMKKFFIKFDLRTISSLHILSFLINDYLKDR